eukprot:6309457-Prymnesium_polylepis.1
MSQSLITIKSYAGHPDSSLTPDLQSDSEKEQMGNENQRCEVRTGVGEGVTVARGRAACAAVAPAARTVANLVPAGSNCFLGVSCALLRAASHICKASIPSVKQPERTSASS